MLDVLHSITTFFFALKIERGRRRGGGKESWRCPSPPPLEIRSTIDGNWNARLLRKRSFSQQRRNATRSRRAQVETADIGQTARHRPISIVLFPFSRVRGVPRLEHPNPYDDKIIRKELEKLSIVPKYICFRTKFLNSSQRKKERNILPQRWT